MDLGRFQQHSEFEWHIALSGKMRVPGILYASESLLSDMDDKFYEQVCNVSTMPGSSRPPMRCPLRTEATVSRLAVSPLSMLKRVEHL